MTDLFTCLAGNDNGERTIAEAIAAGLIDRRLLNQVMTNVFGATDAAGAWTQRESFELLERGLVSHLQTLSPLPWSPMSPAPTNWCRRFRP